MGFLDRKRLLSHLRDDDQLRAMHHILDKVEISQRKYIPLTSDFHDPFTTKLATNIVQGIQGISYKTWGGYKEAEREKIAVFPEEIEFDNDAFQISLVIFQGNFTFFNHNHRHVLGAILASGIKRDKLGDILITKDKCQVISDTKVASYLVTNVVSIGPVSVKGKIKNLADLSKPKITQKEIRITINSMRIDAIISAALFISRKKAAELVNKGRVRANWQPVDKTDFQISEGDMLSIQGYGRIKILEMLGTTKKERLALKIALYL